MVRLWNRLVSLPEERLTRDIFNWDRANRHPWSRIASIILSSSDMHTMFLNILQCNINCVRQKLFIKYEDQWNAFYYPLYCDLRNPLYSGNMKVIFFAGCLKMMFFLWLN